MATQQALFADSYFPQTYRQMDPSGDIYFQEDLVKIDPHSILAGDAKRSILGESVRRITSSSTISESDILRTIIYLMDCKFITYKDVQMVKTPFGLNVTHNLTNEDPCHLNKFQFRLLINRTGPARQVSDNNTPPEVKLEKVIITINLEKPVEVCFGVQKDVFQSIKQAFENLQGLALDNKLKIYVAENGNIKETLLWKTSIINYMQQINQRVECAAASICQGEAERQLHYIYSHSPPLVTMPVKDCYKMNISNKEWTVHLIRNVCELLFGANKLMRVKPERPNLSRWLNRIFRCFELNTSISLQPEQVPSFEDCPFKTAKGIITCTENIREALLDSSVLKTARNATMVQKISYCRITNDDIHPLDQMAPHNFVTLENGDIFRRNNNGGLLTTDVRTKCDLDYIDHNGAVYVLSCVKDGDYGSSDTILKAGLKQITRYDEFIPTGFVFHEDNASKHNDPHYSMSGGKIFPAPQVTHFTDNNGVTRNLSVKLANGWIKNIFEHLSAKQNTDKNKFPFPWLGTEKIDISNIITKEKDKNEVLIKDLYKKGNVWNYLPFCRYADTQYSKLKLFEYIVCNGWMTKEIFLHNVLVMYDRIKD